jgi:hypothetical protein
MNLSYKFFEVISRITPFGFTRQLFLLPSQISFVTFQVFWIGTLGSLFTIMNNSKILNTQINT